MEFLIPLSISEPSNYGIDVSALWVSRRHPCADTRILIGRLHEVWQRERVAVRRLSFLHGDYLCAHLHDATQFFGNVVLHSHTVIESAVGSVAFARDDADDASIVVHETAKGFDRPR